MQWATKSIPIVFAHVSDPIADGVVSDYARPGGNTTGVSLRHRELLAKRFELVRELLPQARRVARVAPYATDPSYAASESIIRETAARLNFDLIEVGPRLHWEIKERREFALHPGHQSQDGAGDRTQDPAIRAVARGHGNRIASGRRTARFRSNAASNARLPYR